VHLLHEFVVGQFGEDDFVVGHFPDAPEGAAQAWPHFLAIS
jgi:hypothetical protein